MLVSWLPILLKDTASAGTQSTNNFCSQDFLTKESAFGILIKIDRKMENMSLSFKSCIIALPLRMSPGMNFTHHFLQAVLTIVSLVSGILASDMQAPMMIKNHSLKWLPTQMRSILWISLLSTNSYLPLDLLMKMSQSGTWETLQELSQHFPLKKML